MEIRIPKCLLKGLEFSDIEFNSPNCRAEKSMMEDNMTWKMGYSDCGMNRVSEQLS